MGNGSNLGAALLAGTLSLASAGASGAVLYSQLDNASNNGVPAQDFEPSIDSYDSEGADDFVVPGGVANWTVTRVTNVSSTGTAGAPATIDVAIYNDNAGVPGGVRCSYAAVTPTSYTNASTVTDLPTPCVLPPGKYWLGLQMNQNFTAAPGQGQYFWSNRLTQTNSPGVWRNPGNGFATGCTGFAPLTTCGVGGGSSPDLLFTIEGAIVNNAVPVPATGLPALFALIAGLGALVLRRLRSIV